MAYLHGHRQGQENGQHGKRSQLNLYISREASGTLQGEPPQVECMALGNKHDTIEQA